MERAERLDFSKAKSILREIQGNGGKTIETYTVEMKDGESFVFEIHTELYSTNGWDGLKQYLKKLVIVSHNGKPCGEKTETDPYSIWERLENAFFDEKFYELRNK